MSENRFEIDIRKPDVIVPSASEAPGNSPVLMIDLVDLRLNEKYRVRAEQDEATIQAYAQAMRNGAEFPPLSVYFAGSDDYVVDGWHRYEAARRAGLDSLPAVRILGGPAELHRVQASANAQHGRRRTNADKRRVIRLLLADEDYVSKSDRGLAQLASVDHKTVSSVRHEMELAGEIEVQSTRWSTDDREIPVHSSIDLEVDQNDGVLDDLSLDHDSQSATATTASLQQDPLTAVMRRLRSIQSAIQRLDDDIVRVLQHGVTATTRDMLKDDVDSLALDISVVQKNFPKQPAGEVNQ